MEANKVNKKKNILIIGAGGHGHVVEEIAIANGYETSFLDDKNPKAIGTIAEIETYLPSFDTVIVAIGNNAKRKEICEEIKALGGHLATLIHPSAYISPSASISLGTIVAPGVIVNSKSSIGEGCILSIGVVVDHDVQIESYVHLDVGSICKAGSSVKLGRKVEAGTIVIGY